MTSNISIRINPKTKKAAQKTLSELGLDLSSGVKMFLEQVVTTQSIPFPVVTPTGHRLRNWKQLKKEIVEAKKGTGYDTAEEAFADIFKNE